MKISALPNQPKVPATDFPFAVRFSEKAPSAAGLSIAVSKMTTSDAFGSTSVAPSARQTVEMTGCVAVVNCQVFADARPVPARVASAGADRLPCSSSPPSSGRVGVKVTSLPFQLKLPGTVAPSLVRFSENAASTEDLFIARSNAAVTFVVRATPEASAAGLTDETVGDAAARTFTIFATEGTPAPLIRNSM